METHLLDELYSKTAGTTAPCRASEGSEASLNAALHTQKIFNHSMLSGIAALLAEPTAGPGQDMQLDHTADELMSLP